jgi:hypothetical protein
MTKQYRSTIIEEIIMFNKWVIITTLSLSLLSSATIGANKDALTSYTTTIKHSNGGGGRGVDNIHLVPPRTNSNYCAVFKKAEIKYSIRRYGYASIVSQPNLNCSPQEKTNCTIDISWKHSPAGGLNYNVKVLWSLQAC